MRLKVIFIWLCFGGILFAEQIDNFEVNITLKPSGEFVVTESILYDFDGKRKHGIYREIPTQAYSMGNINGVKWGGYFDIGLEVLDIKMNNREVEWTKTSQGNDRQKIIKLIIGSNEKMLSGKKLYTIQYLCRNAIMPSSFHANRDKLYWNVTGNRWNVPILQTEVNLLLAYGIDKDDLLVVAPRKFEWIDDHHLYLKTDQKNIALKITFPRGILLQNTELKIVQGRQNLKDIYDKKVQKKRASEALVEKIRQDRVSLEEERKVWGVWSWLVFVLLVYIIWLKRDRFGLDEDRRSIIVQYSPPKGLSVLQAGLLYDKNLGRDDFYAALLELNYLGYVKIEEDEGGEGVVIQRISATRGELSSDQRGLLEALFENSDVFSTIEASSSQYNTLYNRINTIYNRLYIWAQDEGYTVDNLSTLRGRILKKILFISLPISIFSVVIAMNRYYTGEELSYILFSISVALLPGFLASFFYSSLKIRGSAFGVGILVWFMLMEWELFPLQRGLDAVGIVGSYITPIVLSFIVLMSLVWKMGRYRKKGEDVRLALKGLEEFMKSVKEDEMSRRIEVESYYTEKLLPYAVLFGQVNHWFQTYENLDASHIKCKHNTLWKSLERSNLLRSQQSSSSKKSALFSGNSSSSSESSFSSNTGGGGSW